MYAHRPLSPSLQLHFNFNSVQRALVLEDYAPALWVRGVVSAKKGARSRRRKERIEEKKIIINKKLTGKINMKKKEENKHNIHKHIIMWGLVMLVHAWGSS